MNKKILIIVGLLLTLGMIGIAVISSYGSITGYATLEEAITLDIMGSSNDENYTLKSVYQGETKYSPEIKIVNHADVPIDVNITPSILPESIGNNSDVSLSIENEFQNETLQNPIKIPSADLRVRIRHDFSPIASPGNYSFTFTVTPV